MKSSVDVLHLTSCHEQPEVAVLYQAADTLRNIIADVEPPDKYPPTSGIFLQASSDFVPSALVEFILRLIDTNAPIEDNYKPGESTHRMCLAIAECMMFCSRKLITPLHLGLAAQLYNDYGSRALIDTLHHHGFCISYLRRFMTISAKAELQHFQNGVYVPHGIIPSRINGKLTQEGDDNDDIL